MSQKLNKSPTDINLAGPLKKGLAKISDFTDYHSPQKDSTETPPERVPQNTPRGNLKASINEKSPASKLASMLSSHGDKQFREYFQEDTERSSAGLSNSKGKKVLKNNYTKEKLSGHTKDSEHIKPKEMAKAALSKMIARDIAKKSNIIQIRFNTLELHKTLSTTCGKDKSNPPSVEGRQKNKLGQINVIYSDSSMLDQLLLKSPGYTPSQKKPKHITQSPERSPQQGIPLTATHSQSMIKQNIVPLHTPQSSIGTSLIKETYQPKKSNSKHKKIHSIGSDAGFGREFIMLTNGNLTSHLSPQHKRGTSSGMNNSLSNSTMSHSHLYNIQIPKTNNTFAFENRNHLNDSQIPGSKETIESRINDLLLRKDASIDQLQGIKNVFESIIDSYQGEMYAAHSNLAALRKVKQAYEQYFEAYACKDARVRDLEIERDELKTQLLKVSQEKLDYQRKYEQTKSENEKLYQLLKSLNRAKMSPSHSSSNLSTEKKTHGTDSNLDSPPRTKHYSTSDKTNGESDVLKQTLLKQQNTINALKKKESKLIKLLHAIKKQGVDIEKIYNEEIKGKNEDTEEYNIPTFEKYKKGKKDSEEKQLNISLQPEEISSVHSERSCKNSLVSS